MIIFSSQWDLWVTLCNFSLSPWSSSTHRGDEVEVPSVEPEAVSQSLFTGCIQRVEPTVCCYCAHVHYSTPLVCLCRCVSVCVFLCINATHCLARWVPSRPGKERLLEEIGILVRPLKLTNQFRGMMPTLSESGSLMPVTPRLHQSLSTSTSCLPLPSRQKKKCCSECCVSLFSLVHDAKSQAFFFSKFSLTMTTWYS